MTDFRKPKEKPPLKLSSSVILMLCGVIGSVLFVVYLLYALQISHFTRSSVKDTGLAVARTLAEMPVIKQGLVSPEGSKIIAPLAEQIKERNHLLFVVVTDMNGIRYSHPNARHIGAHFIGNDLEPALQGKESVGINRGNLVTSLRVFTPVYNADSQQIGVVIVGMPLSKVDEQISHSRWNMLWGVLFSALVGTIGCALLIYTLKRILFGFEPYEISTLFEQNQAMLQSVKEGIIAIDSQGNITLMNQTARKVLLSPDDFSANNNVVPLPVISILNEVLESGNAIEDREIIISGRQILCNVMPIYTRRRKIGAICTFRDKTEINQLTQQVNGMVSYVDALRERSHEFMNKLHVILGLLQLKRYDKLEAYILQTANNYQTEIGALQSKIRQPVVAGFLIGKISRVLEAGHQLTLDDECFLPDNPNEHQVTVLITVLGNLMENAVDALQGQPEGEIEVFLHYHHGMLTAVVSDNGPGIAPELLSLIFEKGFSTKGEQRGVGLYLVKQQIEHCQGNIQVESAPGHLTQFTLTLPWDTERKNR
ncbi:sensor histidine kinase [Klebsiella sp. BIGb0407]|uniref:sensor histidine kinase n=1 Tax=Klebsiella sp. BIGb0407 TaxID=2940603 RepID=UPI00216724BA|nr:sensor histidine kinase [Klebsiella sp. BIGb0407]MCS3432388.1 two-component system sensor histidine kinase DcuS [Klebsiella sp. BIGb0407]